MSWQTSLLATILVPLLGSFTVPLAGRCSPFFRNLWAVTLGGATLFFAVTLLPGVYTGQAGAVSHPIGLGLNAAFLVDGLSVFMAIASSLVSAFIIVYSLGHFHRKSHQQEYYFPVFPGEPRDSFLPYHRGGTPSMVWGVVLLTFFPFLSGVLVHYPESLVETAVEQMISPSNTHAVNGVVK